MNDNDQDEEISIGRMLFLAVQLRKQLDAADKVIAELRRQLEDKTAKQIAEKHFGYEEPRPPAWSVTDPIGPVSLRTFSKVNTEVLTVTVTVAKELFAYMKADKDHIEHHTKQDQMARIWVRMQEMGLFKQFQRENEHEVIYAMGLEVATQ